DGDIVYTPDADFNGTDTFTYEISDSAGGTDSATVTVTVAPVNDDPVASNDVADVDEDGSVSGVLVASDVDNDIGDLTFSLVTDGTQGSAVIQSDGSYVYTPNANVSGTDSFTYQVSDGNGGTATATVDVTIAAVNDDPVASDDTANTDEDIAVSGTLAASDIENDSLIFSLLTDGTQGSVLIQPDGTYTYTPNPDANGTDSFTYEVTDENGGRDTATVNITIAAVNDAPEGEDDEFTTDAGISVLGQLVASDVEGDALTFSLGTQAGNGSVQVNSDGSFDYTPNAGFSGSDSFTYNVSDGIESVTGEIFITVNAPDNIAPIAVDDSLTIQEDGSGSINVITNTAGQDADSDGDTLTVQSASVGAVALTLGTPFEIAGLGTLTIQADGAATFEASDSLNTLAAGQSATGAASYTITDGNGGSASAVLSLTVDGQNDAPIAADDTVNAQEDAAGFVIDVLANDSDVDNADTKEVVSLNTLGTAGTAVLVDGEVRYTPAADFNGQDTFEYTMRDAEGAESTATVRVNVAAVNDDPIANDDGGFTTGFNTARSFAPADLLANDEDGDPELNQTLTVVQVSSIAGGVAALQGDGTISFTPTDGFSGLASFRYTISDGAGGIDQGVVSLTVGGNTAPTAAAVFADTQEDTSVVVDLASAVNDVDGDDLTISFDQPTNGTFAEIDGVFTYTPNDDFNGVDTFSYTVADGNGGSATSTIEVGIASVNDAPVAADASAQGDEDTVISGQLTATDVDHALADLTFELAGNAGNGNVDLNPDGSFDYTPNPDFNGLDSFTYSVSDPAGGTSQTRTVTITVADVDEPNTDPTANDIGQTTDEDQSVVVDVAGAINDVDGDTLSVLTQQPTNGTFAEVDGVFSYTPNADFNGTDTFNYTVSDGNGGSASASITVTVSSVNDAPVAADASAQGDEDTVISGQLTATDVDHALADLTFEVVSDPSNGDVNLNPDGSFDYTPNGDFFGTDTFTYTARDPDGGTSEARTVTITVADVAEPNSAPIAAEDSITTTEDSFVSYNLIQGDGEVGLDTDDDGDTLEVVSASIAGVDLAIGVTQTIDGVGNVSVASNGLLSFTPDADFQALGNGDEAGATGSYTISDGNGGTDSTAFVLTVQGVNDAPIANADSAVAPFDTATFIDVLGNDTNIDGDDLTLVSVTDGANGTTQINDGLVVYTPNAGTSGQDTFTYVVSDGFTTDTGTVTVNVEDADNTAPTAQDGAITLDEDSQNQGQLLFQDAETGVDGLTVTIESDVDSGTLVLGDFGAFTYTPDLNFFGTDSFTFSVSDGELSSGIQTISITVDAVNDAPVVSALTFAAAEDDNSLSFNLLQGATDVDLDDLDVTDVVITGLSQSVVPRSLDPENGTLVFQSGSLDQLAEGETTTFNVAYSVTDGTVSVANTAVINITGENDDPVAVDDTGSVQQGQTTQLNVVGNDTDVDGDSLSLGSVAPIAASIGTVAIVDGQLSFTAASDFSGDAVLSYTVVDGNGGSDTGTVTIDVSETPNEAPTAADDSFSIGETGSVAANLITGAGGAAADSDPEGNTLSITELRDKDGTVLALGGDIELPDGGKLVVNADGTISFSTAGDFDDLNDGETVSLSFGYTVSDGDLSDDGVITINVAGADTPNTAPVAGDFSVTLDEDGSVAVDFDANTSDADLDALTITPQDGANGSVTLVEGAFVYTPVADFFGSDSFTYTATDGSGASDTGTVSVTVNAVNDAPIAENASANGVEDTAIVGTLNASDVDGDVLTFAVDTSASSGSVAITASGGFTFTPDPDFNGADSFSYSVSDGKGGVDSGVVNLTVSAVNDAPVAKDDAGATNADTAVSVDVLDNDSDVDSADLTVSVAPNALGADQGLLSINSDGSITYDPNGAFATLALGATEKVSFDYTITDGELTDTAAVDITVTGTFVAEPVKVIVDDTGSNGFARGSDADEVIVGGAGSDRMIGGGGADDFDFTGLGDEARNTRDMILDFNSEEDAIILANDDYEVAFTSRQAIIFTGDGDQIRVVGSFTSEDELNIMIESDAFLF
ncbi:MAG: Ig-like domain-containing protein, partial [Paracoccaceae bacterium]